MANSLFERLEETRRRIHRVLLLHGLAWLLTGVVTAVIIAGLADWLVHASGPMRLILLATTFAMAGWLAFRRLLVPLMTPMRDLDLALRIERLNPQLGERLSSGIDFMRSAADDRSAGSRQLRERVVEDALTATEQIDFTSIVESKPAKTMGIWAAVAGAAALALVIASPSDASIALRRFVAPFGGPSWPQRTRLVVNNAPDKVAKGDPFNVAAEVQGVVPDEVTIRFRFPGGDVTNAEPMRLKPDGYFHGGIESAGRSFEYAIAGGDDDTGWRPVEVVPAPDVTAIVLSLEYPAYTGLAPETYAEGRGHVRAVVGTKVKLTAKSNKPLEKAELSWDLGVNGSADVRPATINADGSELAAEFVVERNAGYQILIHDRQGMSNATRAPKRFSVQAVADMPPEVAIEQPPGDMEVTAGATVPLRFLVKDDFGVQKVNLHYNLLREAKPGTAAATSDETIIPLFKVEAPSKRELIEYSWQLEPLKLSNGSVIRFHATAADARTLPAPNVGKSRELRLKVVAKEDYLKQIEQQQQAVREQVQQVLRLQRKAHREVADLKEQAENVGALKPSDVENLQSAEMIQRRIREKIAGSDESLQQEIDRMLANLKSNHVDDPSTQQRLNLIRSELGRINEQHLPPIAQSLTQARKLAKGEQPDSKSAGAEKGEGAKNDANKSDGKTGDAKDSSSDSQGDMKDAIAKADSAAGKEASKGADAKNDAASKSGSESPSDGKDAAGKSSDGKSAKGSEGAGAKSDGSQDGQAGDSKSGDSKSGDSKSGDSKSGDSKSGDSKSGDSKSGGSESATAKSDPKQQEKSRGNEAAKELEKANDHQQQTIDSLAQMLEQLEKWETVGQVVHDARDLQRRQNEVTEQIDNLAKETLGKSEEELTPEQKASLAKAAGRQEDNREQLQRLQRKMDRLAEKTAQEDSTTAETLKEAIELSRSRNLAGQMADAARDVKGNKMGDAAQRQSEINKGLNELLDSLENRKERELTRLVKQLKEAEKEMKGLAEEQRLLKKKTDEAKKIADPKRREDELKRLGKQQRELQKKTEEFARKLSRLQAEQASRGSGRAASRMSKAGQKMEKGQGGGEQGGEQGEAGEDQEEALEELAQAQQELAQARQEAEEELGREQFAKIADSIRQVYERQVAIKQEIVRLDEAKKKTGRWSRGEMQSIAALSRAERGLSTEAGGLGEKVPDAKVVGYVVGQGAGLMNRAADLLNERETGQSTQKAADDAARRFAEIMNSMKNDPDQKKKGGGGQQGGGEGGGGGGGGGGDGIPNIAQIKLLKLLQIEINERTQELSKKKAESKKWSAEDEKELVDLSARQGKLVELIRDMTQPKGDDAPADEEGEKQ